MVVSSPAEFAREIERHPFGSFELDSGALAAAVASIEQEGLFVVGETHGIREVPSVVYAIALAVGARAVAFEWSHEEMDAPVQEFVRTGELDLERLWALPPDAEFFCGDGRIAAGHFALLRRLREEGRLEQAIVFDRLDPEPPPGPEEWQQRDREMAERLLAEWNGRSPLLVLTGSYHARLSAPDGDPMTAHLRRAHPGLTSSVLAFAEGRGYSRGEHVDAATPMPEAPAVFRLPVATPAIVPGPGA